MFVINVEVPRVWVPHLQLTSGQLCCGILVLVCSLPQSGNTSGKWTQKTKWWSENEMANEKCRKSRRKIARRQGRRIKRFEVKWWSDSLNEWWGKEFIPPAHLNGVSGWLYQWLVLQGCKWWWKLSVLIIVLSLCDVIKFAKGWENRKKWSSEWSSHGPLCCVVAGCLTSSELFHWAGWETVSFTENSFFNRKL